MTHGSLFSGIGGFDLAAEWMGWENKFHCEWNPFCQRVLKYYWPDAKSYGDIDNTDFTIWRGLVDVLSGGFPCQPYSTAGKRKGKEDDRHKWPQMLRAIREIQPGYVVGENVRGLTNWNGGLVFDEVQADLETEGYEVLPFLLPACGVNAPHRRDRVWFVAHSNSDGHWRKSKFRGYSGETGKVQTKQEEWERVWDATEGNFQEGFAANPQCIRQQGSWRAQHAGGKKEIRNWKSSKSFHDDRWPVESPICSGDDGISGELDGIAFSDFSKESHSGFGNAIVPQLAYQIFKAIEQVNNNSI